MKNGNAAKFGVFCTIITKAIQIIICVLIVQNLTFLNVVNKINY